MGIFKKICKEHLLYQKQIFRLSKSDLVKTYRGSAVGWSWAFIKPMVTIFVFWFAFSFGLRTGDNVEGYPFFLWMIAGFIPWFYMSEMITGGAGCMRNNKHLITKMKFPVSVIPTFVSISKLVVHIILIAATSVIFLIFGYGPDKYFIQLPIYTIMMFVFFVFWSLFAGILSAFSKDFLNLIKSFTTAIFWMSGIIYNVNNIETMWIRSVLQFNPVTIIASGYRHVFIDKTWIFEEPIEVRNYLIVLMVMAALALWAYGKLHKDMSDVL